MSAEIWNTRIDGVDIVEAAYAEQPAWHGLGEVLPQATHSEEMIEASHLGWKVAKEEIQLVRGGIAIDDHFGLVRQDNDETLGVVGKEYQPLQNTEAFAFLDSLVQDGIIKYESAFALKGGKHVCLLARMPSYDTVVEGDHQLRYVFLSNSHGGGSIVLTPTSVRVVCANTKRMAVGEGRKRNTLLCIRHSGDLTTKLSVALKYLSQFDAAFTLYKENAQKLLVGFTAKQKDEYLEQLFPSPKSDVSDRVKNNRKHKVEQIDRALTSRAQNLPGVKGTLWSLFNAVTETVDHGDKLRQATDLGARRENRFLDVVSGAGANFKDDAFAVALELAA